MSLQFHQVVLARKVLKDVNRNIVFDLADLFDGSDLELCLQLVAFFESSK